MIAGAFIVFIIHKEIDFVFYEGITIVFRQLKWILSLRCISQPENEIVFSDVHQHFVEIILDFSE